MKVKIIRQIKLEKIESIISCLSEGNDNRRGQLKGKPF